MLELARQQLGRQMVGAHELDGCGREDALAIQFAAVAQHLCKAVVILGSRYHAASARRHGRFAIEVAVVDCFGPSCGETAFGIDPIYGGKARPLILRDKEASVFHAKRRIDVFAHELGKRFS